MIKNLYIENFMSWKKGLFEFTNGVNVIMGQSHKGKSAVIKSLRWLIHNKPRGDAFKNWDTEPEDEVRVQVCTDDEFKLDRFKNKNHNAYMKDGLVLQALKTDVPEEISSVLRLDDINLQTQFEGYFLLQDSPGEVGKRLNKLVGLSVIDKAISTVNGIVTKEKSDVAVSDETVEGIKEKLGELSWVNKAKEEAEKIQVLVDTNDKIGKMAVNIEHLLASIKKEEEVLKNIRKFLEIEEACTRLKETIDTLNTSTKEYNTLVFIRTKIKATKQDIEFTTKWLEVIPKHKAICSLVDEFDQINNERTMLSRLIEEVQDKNRKILILSDDITEYQEKRDNIMKELKICPLCGQKIS